MREEISKNWKNGTPKNPLVPGDIFHFRVAVLQKCFEIYVNDKLYGTFEHLDCPKKINYALVTGDFEKITQFHHRMLFPLVFPRCLGTSCSEKLCFQSDVSQKYETGFFDSLKRILFSQFFFYRNRGHTGRFKLWSTNICIFNMFSMQRYWSDLSKVSC